MPSREKVSARRTPPKMTTTTRWPEPPEPCCPPPARDVLGRPRPTSRAAAALRKSRRDGSPTRPELLEKVRERSCSFTRIYCASALSLGKLVRIRHHAAH